jgi:hypothetical protein
MGGRVSIEMAKQLMERAFSLGGKHFGYISEPVVQPRSAKYQTRQVLGHRLRIHPVEAMAIWEVFRDFTEKGMSCGAIVRSLNQRLLATGKPRPPRGTKWTITSLQGTKVGERGILRQELYVGRYRWKDAVVDLPELRIIKDTLWDMAQERLALVSRVSGGIRRHGKPTYSKHLLTGIVKCAHCGSNVVIVSGGSFAKYGCSKSSNSSGRECGNVLRIKKSDLEELFLKNLEASIGKEAMLRLLAELEEHPVTGRAWLFNHVKEALLFVSGVNWDIKITVV